MARTIVVHTVGLCTRHPWPIIGLAVLMTMLSSIYTARHFAISTDIEKLISSDLPWHRRQQEFYDAFRPTREILVVVEASTPEFADAATDTLVKRLSAESGRIGSVRQIGGGAFFEQEGFLF